MPTCSKCGRRSVRTGKTWLWRRMSCAIGIVYQTLCRHCLHVGTERKRGPTWEDEQNARLARTSNTT